MKGRNRRKCSYTLSLTISCAIAAVIWAYGLIRDGEASRWLSDTTQKAQAAIATVQSVWEKREYDSDGSGIAGMEIQTMDFGVSDGKGQEEENTVGIPLNGADKPEQIRDEASEADAEDAAEETEEAENEVLELYEAERTYFDDALFIGDSRTVGLQEYGNLGNAEVVADLGMSVYKIFTKKFPTVSGEKKRLETVLTERQFGKIYLMMGINELGYDFDHTVAKYKEMIEKIRQLQPQALIFLEANLHITEKKSASSPIYNNENINRFNEALAQMADEKTIFYLDANVLFDDETGNLSEECTTDDTHILARYYPEWTEWILQHARKTDSSVGAMEADLLF